MSIDALLTHLLVLGVYPLWLLAGAADWACHRATLIERTAGPRESVLHLVLIGTVAVPVVLGVFLEVTAGLVAVAAGCVVAHTAISVWDTSYTTPRRFISPLEQHVHAYLESLPWFALAIVVVLHWEALREPEWALTPREVPLPRAAVVVALAALAGGAILIVEELLRGLRAAPRRAVPAP